MAYKDLIFQNQDFVALENKEPIPVLWVDENFGVILSECNYRCVFHKYAENVDAVSWSYDDMFYNPSTSTVFLVCYDVFNVSLYRPEIGLMSYYFDEEKGHVVCKITSGDGVCTYRDIEDCTLGYIDTIGTREEYMIDVLDVIRDDTGLDLTFLVKMANLNCKVYPFLRVESLSRELGNNGLKPFSEDSFPIVYVNGTEGYEQYFRPELSYEPDDALATIGQCVSELIEEEASAEAEPVSEPVMDDAISLCLSEKENDVDKKESMLEDEFSGEEVKADTEICGVSEAEYEEPAEMDLQEDADVTEAKYEEPAELASDLQEDDDVTGVRYEEPSDEPKDSESELVDSSAEVEATEPKYEDALDNE